ncbi:hypothetical protein CQ018_11450 [Arthrobacter sp. MYb227]|uniref:hypothetical protein n=1 Tax=Arthrobacter sp. MYb227 TaxID=1848601 RepID=UPI000CFBE3E1|nr:hypothetical protein [Arthrobacter sp. MYb227]PQZ92136.1 hypothetical protein CQ018_11450 [Arthrobacter sp. MYb227]
MTSDAQQPTVWHPNAHRPHVLRMFPDYADTVLWISEPINYSQTGLSASLIEELMAWEQLFYDSLNRDHEFASRGLEDRFTRAGITLAKKIASEIGSDFIVQYDAAASLNEPIHYQCPGTASNKQAAASFQDLFTEVRREEKRMAKLIKHGSLYALAPLSGQVFDPSGVLKGRNQLLAGKNRRSKKR